MTVASPTPEGDQRLFIYRLNARDEIIFVNDEWYDFARENGAQELDRQSVLQKSLWDFIDNAETRHLFEIILTKVRTEGRPKVIPYRCDTPGLRRFMELEVRLAEDGMVEFRSRIVREERRESVRLMELDVERSDELLCMCSWCKRVSLPEARWVEVEEAVEELRLFEATILPKVSHGICPACLASFDYQLAEL